MSDSIALADAERATAYKHLEDAFNRLSRHHDDGPGTGQTIADHDAQGEIIRRDIESKRHAYNDAVYLYDIARSPPPPDSQWYVTAYQGAGPSQGNSIPIAGPFSTPRSALDAKRALVKAIVRDFPKDAPYCAVGLCPISRAVTVVPVFSYCVERGSATDPNAWQVSHAWRVAGRQ